MNDIAREWEHFGAKDPYYWVTTFEKYRDEVLSEERISDFFNESKDYVCKLLTVIEKHISPNFKPSRVLDFGCGVGRVSIPLAEVADEVIGLDISKTMLAEARKNKERYNISNLELFQSDDQLTNAKGTFNFIHSIYVLQHIPFSRGKKIVEKMLELLDNGGVLALQFLISNDLPKIKRISYWMRLYIPGAKNVLNLLRRKSWNSPMMQLNNYDLTQMIEILKRGDCDQLYIRYTKDHVYNGVIIVAQKSSSKVNSEFIDLGQIP